MTHAGAVSRRFRVQVSKYLTGGSHVYFFYSSRPIFPTFVVIISRFVLRPVCLYPILQYIYIFFNTTFPPLDGNRCHSLNRPTAYRNPDPSLSLSLSPHFCIYIPGIYFTSLLSFSSVVVPIYLGELAPLTLRGTLGTMTYFAFVIGILGSNLIAFPLPNAKGWRYMFALTPPMPAAVDLVCPPLLLESPR